VNCGLGIDKSTICAESLPLGLQLEFDDRSINLKTSQSQKTVIIRSFHLLIASVTRLLDYLFNGKVIDYLQPRKFS